MKKLRESEFAAQAFKQNQESTIQILLPGGDYLITFGEIKELLDIKSRLETYSQNLYTTYKAESRKLPNGYVHAIPWFLIENKIQWVLTGVDHIQEVESKENSATCKREGGA